ncbi:MAG TPA: 3,4-dihydroxy-2-butanone-4-phosphate synthase [Solirubrobacterales bacterium]|jgi:3,4-dihydroxy 2-butanone 4-phosphate synthase/GTP cyclohydrolase II
MADPLLSAEPKAPIAAARTGLAAALEALRAQGPVLCTLRQQGSQPLGAVVVPAASATPQVVNFMVRHCRGIVSAALTEERCEDLVLSPQDPRDDSAAAMITVEAREGVTSGISAFDRSRTLRQLGDPGSVATDFVRPGHILPLRARPGALDARAGHAELAVELMRRAGLEPTAALCQVLAPDGRLADVGELRAFAGRFEMPLLALDELR